LVAVIGFIHHPPLFAVNLFLPSHHILPALSAVSFAAPQGNYIRETLTVDTSQNPGRSLCEKLVTYLKPKCHALLLDPAINSLFTVRLNVYQNFLLCAMK